jgi:hypothetical protein
MKKGIEKKRTAARLRVWASAKWICLSVEPSMSASGGKCRVTECAVFYVFIIIKIDLIINKQINKQRIKIEKPVQLEKVLWGMSSV